MHFESNARKISFKKKVSQVSVISSYLKCDKISDHNIDISF